MSGPKRTERAINRSVNAFWHYRLNTESRDALRQSLLRASESMLREYFGDLNGIEIDHEDPSRSVRENIHLINRYPNLAYTHDHPKKGQIIEVPHYVRSSARKEVAVALLEGSVMRRVEAGGESKRLGLGPRYLLMPDVLVDAGYNGNGLLSDAMRSLKDGGIIGDIKANVLPICLGDRHLLQIAFMQAKAGIEHGFLKHQWKDMLQSTFTLMNLNSSNSEEIIKEHVNVWQHFGFKKERTLYVEQEPENGYIIRDGRLVIDETSEKRLLNHGFMMITCTMDGKIFRMEGNDRATYSSSDFMNILDSMIFVKSSPIEDSDFLTQKPDYAGFSTALNLAKQGYNMVMEVTGQKTPPQKGGVWKHDENYDRPVIIESDMFGIKEHDETAFEEFLATTEIINRNMNYFLSPKVAHQALKYYGLPMHLSVFATRHGAVAYPQPPQGDLNFILPTAFVRKRGSHLIKGLKKLSDIPDMLRAMAKQDMQPGFKHFVEQFGVVKIR